jgi:hypothetical protein
MYSRRGLAVITCVLCLVAAACGSSGGSDDPESLNSESGGSDEDSAGGEHDGPLVLLVNVGGSDHDYFLVGSPDGSAVQPAPALQGHEVAYSTNGELLLGSPGFDQGWDVLDPNGTVVGGPINWTSVVQWSPSGSGLAFQSDFGGSTFLNGTGSETIVDHVEADDEALDLTSIYFVTWLSDDEVVVHVGGVNDAMHVASISDGGLQLGPEVVGLPGTFYDMAGDPGSDDVYVESDTDVIGRLDADTGEFSPVTEVPENGGYWSWSPEGDRLAMFTSDYVPVICDVSESGLGCRDVQGYPGDLDAGGEPEWAPDGSQVAFNGFGSGAGTFTAYVVDTESGDAQAVQLDDCARGCSATAFVYADTLAPSSPSEGDADAPSPQEVADELGARLAENADDGSLDEVSPGFSSVASELLSSLGDSPDVAVGTCSSTGCLVTIDGVAWTWAMGVEDGRPVVLTVTFEGGGL